MLLTSTTDYKELRVNELMDESHTADSLLKVEFLFDWRENEKKKPALFLQNCQSFRWHVTDLCAML